VPSEKKNRFSEQVDGTRNAQHEFTTFALPVTST